MLLASLGCQITEMEHLLQHTWDWLNWPAAQHATRSNPELRATLDFFGEYARWTPSMRASRTQSLLTKLAPFSLDPAMRALHGAASGTTSSGLSWNEVVGKRQAVLLDFRHLRDHETRRFELVWCFHYLLDFIRHRGAGRHRPLALYIDELASLFHMQSAGGANPLQEDLDELINVRMRSHMIWLCTAYQEAYQLDERTQKTLLTLGTQILGSTSDMDTALATAKQFFPIDPLKVKRYEPVYGSMFGMPQVLDHRPVEYTVEEQQLLASYRVKEQPTFHFLVRCAKGEGDATGRVHPVTIRNFDQGIWVDEEVVSKARAVLSKRCGVAVEKVLNEFNLRLPSSHKPATMNRYAQYQSNQSNRYTSGYSYARGSTRDRRAEEEDILREEKRVPA
jgi:hypothetical protein